MRAKTGEEVTVVIQIGDDGHERTAVFSTVAAAEEWMSTQHDDLTHVCVDTMVVDVPEYGNEAQQSNG